MSTKTEGKWLVMRNSQGEIVSKTRTEDRDGNEKNRKETYRDLLRKITNNGLDQLEVMTAISKGQAFTPSMRMPDGSTQYGEPIVPNVTNMMYASQWLVEYLHGKAVVQTEVVAAEKEAKLSAQAAALSDSELEGQILEALAERGKIMLPSGNGEPERTDPKDKEPEDRRPGNTLRERLMALKPVEKLPGSGDGVP